MKKVLFIKNATILTITALTLRIIGMAFRVWLAGSIGAEGMGLYQVIFSVYVLAATFATSGISTAVTRIITNRLIAGDSSGARRTLYISSAITLIVAAVTSLIIITFAQPISKYLIDDVRATLSLKILCLGLPFMGVCSCIRGYFLARRSTLPPSVCQIAEQLVRMCVIVFLVNKYADNGLAFTSAAVLFGDSVAEAANCFLLWIFYKFDFKNLSKKAVPSLDKKSTLSELLRISLPISGGRYLHTALRTIESIITPTCLLKYSGSKTSALEQFGMIKGMALPILLFPASLLSAISTLLIPEITESVSKKDIRAVQSAAQKVFTITSGISFLISAIFFTAAYPLGKLIYNSPQTGYLIKALAPLIPFMYVDLIADGVLKGLDEQTFLFKINVADSFVRVILVFVLVPPFGMLGFLAVMIFSNLFTSTLSVIKIIKTTKVFWSIKKFFSTPLLSAVFSAAISDYICQFAKTHHILYIILVSASICILYFVFMILFKGIDVQIFSKKKRLFMGKKAKTV